MTTLALKRSINIALSDWNHDDSKASFHYAFAIKNNKIIAWGKNNETSGSKFALKIGHMWNIEKWKNYPYLHAECDVLSKLNLSKIDDSISVLSLRINRHGKFRIAKPCPNCEKALKMANVKTILWSETDMVNENLILRTYENDVYEFKRLGKIKSRSCEEAFQWN
jgi:deoxycytidylate deaminase